MAITYPSSLIFRILIISILFSSIFHKVVARSNGVSMEPKGPKLIPIHFFWHDVVSGHNATSINITKPITATSFGQINMIDNLLTEGLDPTSKVVGRAQGLYAFDSLQTRSLLMAMNIVFTGKKYNGSTITILGSNPILEEVREMPVVGGSGYFRNIRGYALAKTSLRNGTTKDSTVEYNVYVLKEMM